jgi:hypothetical protein
MAPTLTLQDPVRYVAELELCQPRENFNIAHERGAISKAIVQEGQDRAFISDKTIVSFVSGVSGQNREDVLSSTLLAQLAANKKFSVESDTISWYKEFTDVLMKIGWQLEGAEMNTFKSSHDIYEVEHIIVDILVKAFGNNFIGIVTNTLDVLKKMSKSNDNRILAFEKNTHTLNKGYFQIALVKEVNGAISMQLGTFLLTSSNELKKILFVKFSKDKTTLEYSSRRATFNPVAYNKIRSTVEEKLGNFMTTAIAEIEI